MLATERPFVLRLSTFTNCHLNPPFAQDDRAVPRNGVCSSSTNHPKVAKTPCPMPHALRVREAGASNKGLEFEAGPAQDPRKALLPSRDLNFICKTRGVKVKLS